MDMISFMDLKKFYGYDTVFMDMTEQKEVEPWQSQSNNNFRLSMSSESTFVSTNKECFRIV